MRTLIVFACILLLCVAANNKNVTFPSTVYGIDVSQSFNSDELRCLVNFNLTFTIVRCWTSVGRPDGNCPGTVASAWAAGMTHVDVYMFPCYSCGNPAGQVVSAVNFMNQNNVKYGQFWFDIEGPQYWSSNQGANADFFQAMKNQGAAMGLPMAVYTSRSQWEPIMGGYTGGSDLPLWYAHYDGEPSFDDFSPFGGWTHPNMKQFNDNINRCGVNYDLNWYPP